MSRAAVVIVILFVAVTVVPPSSFGQDVLADHKTRGLRGLASVAIVERLNTPQEIASAKEWGDMLEVGLGRDLPKLARTEAQGARAWLELSVVTSDDGAVLELSLYRWVTIVDSGEEVFSKVWWDSRMFFGRTSKELLKNSLDALVTAFTADYFRANR